MRSKKYKHVADMLAESEEYDAEKSSEASGTMKAFAMQARGREIAARRRHELAEALVMSVLLGNDSAYSDPDGAVISDADRKMLLALMQ
jgi:hypothetical protein